MTHSDPAGGAELTARGAATRARIVQAAVDLMYVNGVTATTLDHVRAASGTSKSQLYQHFPDKQALIDEVIRVRAAQILGREQQTLENLNSIAGLRRWGNSLVAANALQHGAYGCALGSMASELSDRNESSRSQLAETFTRWRELIAAGLDRMQANGTLESTASVDDLATGLLAALQGGYLLAETQHDVGPMAIALGMAIDHIERFSTRSVDRPRLRR